MLTTTQIEARKGKLTASRVACLMTADPAKIMQLYLEMIGEGEPEDLSHVWPVRLGEATEQLQLDWYEQKCGYALSCRGSVLVHPKYPWAAATLDGFDERLLCPIECKHVGGREPLEVIIDRYQPQMQWQMECAVSEECGLSVIMGANEPIIEYIPRDAEYAAEMIVRGKQFIDCVAARRVPVALAAVPSPIDASAVYDMTPSNSWAISAADWLLTKEPAERCASASKILKAMVPADAKKCMGHGVRITRDRAGRLSLRELTE